MFLPVSDPYLQVHTFGDGSCLVVCSIDVPDGFQGMKSEPSDLQSFQDLGVDEVVRCS